MTLAVHERQSRHYVTEGGGHSRFFSAVLGRDENHRKVAPENKSHQPLKVVLKIKKVASYNPENTVSIYPKTVLSNLVIFLLL